MVEKTEENISALVDGEIAGQDINALLNELRQNPKSLECWQHYHLISDALHNNLSHPINCNLAQCVSQALASEATHTHTSPTLTFQPRPFSLTAKPVMGFALAASVAAFAYLGFGGKTNDSTIALQRTAAVTATMMPVTVAENTSGPDAYRTVKGAHWDVIQPAMESKLNDYLLNHDEYSAYAGVQRGMLPHVRIVGYDPADPAQ